MKAKTLANLLDELPTREDIHRILGEAQMMDEYPAVMIASSLLEAMLRHLLQAYFVNFRSGEEVKLFGTPKGALNSLSAKADIAYAMGLVGPKTKDLLDALRRIRNFFAHYTLKASFAMPEMQKDYNAIATPKRYAEGSRFDSIILTKDAQPKMNYVHICMFLCMEINNHIALKNHPDYQVDKPIEIY